MAKIKASEKEISFDQFKQEVLNDYRIAFVSRQASITGRKEVLTGKAKFGIFGDGKEVPQIAMAKAFRNGDWRAGYYRDQTFMMAIGALTVREYFAQLYADTEKDADPISQGRMMNGHFGTRLINEDGTFKDLTQQKNSSADISPTGGQMPRLLGLALASKHYRHNRALQAEAFGKFSSHGDEVAFGTIGDSSTSEGLFWETINAAGVMQVPLAISVWDDGYGISVSQKYQTIKQSISEALAGFQKTDDKDGILIYSARAWDYPALCDMYQKGVEICRSQHIPVLFHVMECTQPQGHSTSGSHERYKSKERLKWEEEFDCIKKMREFILHSTIASEEELNELEAEARKHVNDQKRMAWDNFIGSVKRDIASAATVMQNVANASTQKVFIEKIISGLKESDNPERKLIVRDIKKVLRMTAAEPGAERTMLVTFLKNYEADMRKRYSSDLFCTNEFSPLQAAEVKPVYDSDAPLVDGREVLLANTRVLMEKYPNMIAFGEDVGKIGGVNQTYAGLQEQFGEMRVGDTGIREITIIGQGLGMAMRGLRPVAEIQYLDYLVYALTTLTDDVATLCWRTKGGQLAPLIVSTRGHRLEGVWHAGSPMQMLLGSLRGMHLCVPRNMTQAAGMYNTLLKGFDPALVIECLNGYRLKESMPSNIGTFTVPLGVPEILTTGTDVTIVSYGSAIRVVQEAIAQLSLHGISCELVDVQTLLPFDIKHVIVQSLKKTNRLVLVDEDVPGGATAFMLQKIMEEQGGYKFLDAAPVTVTAQEHRTAYGSDGDYFSKSTTEMVIDAVYELMHESDPIKFPALY